jgi:hypothetical protein
MGELERLTAIQLREAAEVLGEWIAGQRHEAQVAAEVRIPTESSRPFRALPHFAWCLAPVRWAAHLSGLL